MISLFNCFKKFIICVLTLILSILIAICIPLTLIAISPIYMFRLIVFHTAYKFKPELGKMLTARSASMILEDDIYGTPKMSGVLVAVLEGSMSIEKIREIINAQGINAKFLNSPELLYPELTQNITSVLGFPFWTPVKGFKLEDCVYEAEEFQSNPMDHSTMCQFIRDLAKKPYTKDRPMWELIFVPNYIPNSTSHEKSNGNKNSVLICRAHHALADGFSMLKIVKKFDTLLPKNASPPAAPQDAKDSSTVYRKFMTLMDFIQILSIPITLSYYVADLLVKKLIFKPFMWELKGDKCGSLSLANTDWILLSDIKEIKNFYNVSFTAVVLAGMANCIRQMIMTNSVMNKNLNHSTCVEIGLPFPLPNHPEKLRNHMGGGMLNLHLGLGEKDPVRRLKKIDRDLNKLKRSTSTMVLNKFGLIMIGGLPLPFTRPFVKVKDKLHGAFLTSFPGPTETMELFGCPVEDLFGTSNSIVDSNLLCSAFITYRGSGKLFLAADTSLIPTDEDAASLIEAFCKELDVLKIGMADRHGHDIV